MLIKNFFKKYSRFLSIIGVISIPLIIFVGWYVLGYGLFGLQRKEYKAPSFHVNSSIKPSRITLDFCFLYDACLKYN